MNIIVCLIVCTASKVKILICLHSLFVCSSAEVCQCICKAASLSPLYIYYNVTGLGYFQFP